MANFPNATPNKESAEQVAASLKDAVTPQTASEKTGTAAGGGKTPPVVATATEDSVKIISELTEEMIMECDLIEARPLGYGSLLDVKPIRTEYAYRWINRFNRQRFLEAKALGFQLATKEDVEIVEEMIQDGAIMVGDLILMKMQKIRYFGALKAKDLRSLNLGTKKKLDEKGLSEGQKTIEKLGPAEKIRRQVSVYNPPIGEIDGKIS